MISLTGCNALTTKSNITSLLSAPKLSENESDIVAAIEAYLGEDISLKDSQSQGYSAPIQLIDIDFDSVYEAVVFYYAPNKGTNIRFALLSYGEEGWNMVFDKEGLGAEVFYFDTIVLPKIQGKQIMVGYQPTNIDENFFVTYFTDSEKEIPDYVESCQDIISGDMTGSGYSDIILTKTMANGNTSLNVLNFTEDMTFKILGVKTLKYSNIEIVQLKINCTSDGKNALYVDYSDGSSRMHTEIYSFENCRIKSEIANGIVSKSWEYEPVISSRDMNGDGFLETASVLSTQQTERMQVYKFMEWADWTQQEPQRVYYGIYWADENMFAAIPDEWQDLVYATGLENGFEIKTAENDETLFKITEIDAVNDVEDGAYSYTAYIGTKMWHIQFSENMNMSQIEYVYKSLLYFD